MAISIVTVKMAPALLNLVVLLSMVAMFAVQLDAGDPDILADFLVPSGTDASLVDGTFFTYTDLVTSNAADPARFTVSKATAAEFPALLGQSVSYAALVFGPGTVNPPHIHPRASELLYVVQGPLQVGLVNAVAGEVYTQTLSTGDMFVFPRGMVHFQINDGNETARAFSAFGGASPGTVSLPAVLFDAGIDDAVLEKSLKTDEATVDALKNDLAPEAPAPAALPPTPPPPSSSDGASTLVSTWSAMTLLCSGAAAFLML